MYEPPAVTFRRMGARDMLLCGLAAPRINDMSKGQRVLKEVGFLPVGDEEAEDYDEVGFDGQVVEYFATSPLSVLANFYLADPGEEPPANLMEGLEPNKAKAKFFKK